MSSPSRCLLLFTKPAIPGRVKTRLTGEGGLSPGRAARLHAAFLGDVVERLLPLTEEGAGDARIDLRLAWALAEGSELPTLARELARGGVADVSWPPTTKAGPLAEAAQLKKASQLQGVAQRGADLGERLYGALATAASDHPGGVAAVGSDHPGLPRERVVEAFAALREADIAIGPADDGGYYLIALRPSAVQERVFADIPWSTEGVLAATEARCRELGLQIHQLPPGHDVDVPADLRRLAQRWMDDPLEADCPRTYRLLADWDLLTAGTAKE